VTLCIPDGAEYLTVVFAVVGGGTHKQRIDVHAMRRGRRAGEWCDRVCDAITHAARSAKRRKVAVANCLRITHGKAVLFDNVADVAGRFA
jgi:hypothetical protein